MTTLVHMTQSPWSEKARWALDHHQISYKSVIHLPMVFEPVLRLLSREPRKKVTVPMLFAEGGVYRDSLEIALFAEQRGNQAPLFPEDKKSAIFGWNDSAETLMMAERGRLMVRLLASKPALQEAVPPPLDKLGSAMLPVAKVAAGFVASKYTSKSSPPAQAEAIITSVLEQAEAALFYEDYLVGSEFTFADVALASALGMIAPHARQPLGPASREVWTEPAIAAAFPSLLAWRDRIFEQHR